MSGCRWVCVALLAVNFAWAQEVTLTARVELLNADKAEKSHESGTSWFGLYRCRARSR